MTTSERKHSDKRIVGVVDVSRKGRALEVTEIVLTEDARRALDVNGDDKPEAPAK